MAIDAHENKDICAKCGGKCCKSGGCQYLPEDFEDLSIDYLEKKLKEGNISITSVQEFGQVGKNKTISHMLYLRVRNENRDIIDLISPRTRCSLLTDTGCPFTADERPSGGKNLIPGANDTCTYQMEPEDFIYSWQKYQKILQRLVQRISGKSVNANIKSDVYELFIKIFRNDFKGINIEERNNMIQFAKMLVSYFPEEFAQARKDALNIGNNIKR